MNCPHCTEKYSEPVPCRRWNGNVWYCLQCNRTWESVAPFLWAVGTVLVTAVVTLLAWLFW